LTRARSASPRSAKGGECTATTDAVLWLREREIDIRCIRLRPYIADDKTLIDVQQVIPLPEAQDYMIRIREKEQQERRSRTARFSEESQQACVDYWQGVLNELAPAGILEPGIRPGRKEDMRFKVGWPQFWLKAYFSRRQPKAAVWLDCRGESGLANFDALKSHRAEIESALNEPLVWTTDAEREQGSLSIRLTGIDANDRADWPPSAQAHQRPTASALQGREAVRRAASEGRGR
jgi:hypothetical protein